MFLYIGWSVFLWFFAPNYANVLSMVAKSKVGMFWVSICDICVKWKILVINEKKQDKILLKLKVLDQEKLHSAPWTYVKFLDKVCPTFIHFQWHEQKLS